MRRARDQYPEQFDEVFREGSATLLAELANLKTIINRFSDFSKMPPPERQSISLNEIVRGVVKLVEAQLAAQKVTPRIELDPALPAVEADPAAVSRTVDSISERNRRAEAHHRCPQCHADHFTQRASRGELPLPITSPAPQHDTFIVIAVSAPASGVSRYV